MKDIHGHETIQLPSTAAQPDDFWQVIVDTAYAMEGEPAAAQLRNLRHLVNHDLYGQGIEAVAGAPAGEAGSFERYAVRRLAKAALALVEKGCERAARR